MATFAEGHSRRFVDMSVQVFEFKLQVIKAVVGRSSIDSSRYPTRAIADPSELPT